MYVVSMPVHTTSHTTSGNESTYLVKVDELEKRLGRRVIVAALLLAVERGGGQHWRCAPMGGGVEMTIIIGREEEEKNK